jgi:SAM-dependent methyltransferase
MYPIGNDMTNSACMCLAPNFVPMHTYSAPPKGEVHFDRVDRGDYHRQLLRCRTCGHVVSRHQMDLGGLYVKDYVDSNYADLDGIRRNFERIQALPAEQSDNAGRVARLLAFAGPSSARRSIADIGSGLCVFLHRMKEAGWDCTAVDPDARSCQHARETVGVRAVCGEFMRLDDLGSFDAITFNKVLEHVPNPIDMLAHACRFLKPEGFVYLELPDVEAWREGPGREEFFIDHFHVFSMPSIVFLAQRAGFELNAAERLREPSTKFTLRAFLRLRRS